jgi:hypothetical protein
MLQYVLEEYRAKLLPTHQIGAQPKHNSERGSAGEALLATLEVSHRQALPLHNYPGQLVEVVLPREGLNAASAAVTKRRIWGSHRYTTDSDILPVLIHEGFLAARCGEATFGWPKRIEQIRAIVRVHESEAPYEGSIQNGISSRNWVQPFCGSCYSIERAWLLWLEVRSARRVRRVCPEERQHAALQHPTNACSRYQVPLRLSSTIVYSICIPNGFSNSVRL